MDWECKMPLPTHQMTVDCVSALTADVDVSRATHPRAKEPHSRATRAARNAHGPSPCLP